MALPGYLHKKFKKLASVDVEGSSVSSGQDARDTLKHSVGSMVGPAPSPQAQVQADGDRRRHSRPHTNERPYSCESCKFSFKTRNNLFKHRKCRSHILRIEKGIESSGAEILAELGDTAGEELDLVNPMLSSEPRQRLSSDLYSLYSPDPSHHPARHHQPGLVLLPSQLVKPGPGPRYPPYHLSYPAQVSHPPLRFIEQPGQPLSLLNGHHIVQQSAEHPREHPREHTRDHLRDHSRDHPREHPRELPPPPESFPGHHHSPGLPRQKIENVDSVHHATTSLYPQSYPFPGHHGSRDVVRLVERVQYREPLGPADHPTKKLQQPPPATAPHINAESLEQRINKVISENQAIVETLDPFWKGRYMRQSSREEINTKERSRRFSQSSNSAAATGINNQVLASPHSEEVSQNSADRYRPSHPNSFRESNPNLPSSLSVNYISNNVPPPPRPDSNIPLNLSDTGRKRKSPENPLIDAHSVKEVWLNSQKKTGNISHLEDIASSIEAKLRSSENPFHPDNPEGSIIKDLLLKTRQGHIILASSTRVADGKDREADRRGGDSPESNIPINLQMSPGSKALAVAGAGGAGGGGGGGGDVGIPVPKNFLPSSKSSGPIETSLYQCNLCMVTFKSLESIEIHQSHYCKNSRHSSDLMRPGPGDRRKSETGSSIGEPPVKRPRSDSLPVPANVTVSGASLGLLQIAASKTVTTVSNIPGIPTPNLSGVLTGIKSQPLFSLPGVRASSSVHAESVSKPVYTMSNTTQEDKPVTYVLGIPGPYSQAGPRPSVMAPTNMSGLKIDTSGLPHDDSFVKPPLTLPSPARDRAAQPRLAVNSGQQRKYDFLPRLESPRRQGEVEVETLTSPPGKPDRPNSLALPPAALFKKKDVAISGATLISPETPRPKKAYQLHYQNGTAYTFLGLKCSTRVFFCSIHKPQPNYVQLEKNSRVSMYSNWKVVSKDSHPSGLSAKVGMSAYNSFNQHCTSYGNFTMAAPKKSLMITTHSSRWHEKKTTCHTNDVDSSKPVRTVEGGFKSADDNYTYIRGRGRGKYICDTCGIRCKKPSMLKKHIRTHTNVRPFTCKYCNFSFKTKGNLTKHMKSKAHSKKCVELGIVPVPTTAEDQQMDDSKSSGEIAMAGDSDTDDCDDADDLDEDDDDEQNTEDQFDDASAGSSKVPPSGSSQSDEENSNAMLGLAPRAPRFSMLTLSSGSSTPVSNTLGPTSPDSNLIVAVSKISEHEQLTRNTRLATVELDNNEINKMEVTQPRKEFQIDTGPIPCGSKIWSIAKLTDNPGVNIPRPGFLEIQKQPQDLSGPGVGYRHQAADILSPVTESATILSYIDKTSCKVMRLSDQVVTTDTGLKNYLQERAAIRAKQHSVSYESNDLTSNACSPSVVIKEEPSNEPVKSQSCVEFPHTAYSHTDTIPQNVTMNVKDMPPILPASGPQPPPEFSIPHISKAESPMRANKGGGQESMRIKTPETINQSSVQSASRSTDSPASNSSQDNESASGASKTDSSSSSSTEKGSVISNPQEIFQVNEDGKSVCGICKKIFSKPSQLRLHVNIHYFERPFRCESCAVSFRTKGHLQKHKRSVGHFNKVNINATFGTPSQDNPRPFKCGDCVIAFRIHGHLAKHLRSKMHIMKLECIGKLPIGMYAEMERLGTNLNEIDTTDCENSLESLQQIAVKLYEKDPSKLTSMDEPLPNVSTSSDLSDEEDSNLAGPDIKEEPVEVVPNITAGVRVSPSIRPAEAGPRLGDRQSYSSGQEDPSTDSDTETTHSLKCPQCPQVFTDMKSLQIHSFVEHHGPENRPSQSQVLNLSQSRGSSPADQPVSCHICGVKHLQTHAAFRPYICQLCDAGFTSPAQLESHSKLHQ